MKSESENNELLITQAENRHLKETIVALREAMEKQKIEHESNIQSALSSANDEISQLRAAIGAMRTEMEKIRMEHATKIQDLEREYNDEKNQLKQMIAALREQLENSGSGAH
ncbi:hypothetical protein LLG96_11855 [bacterium]|nr:hypothetical protein [bacterium]